MRKPRIAVLISMEDEVETVNFTLSRIAHVAKEIRICRSTGKKNPFGDLLLPDETVLQKTPKKRTNQYGRAVQTITHNFSKSFSLVRKCKQIDWVVAITGDTKMYHLVGVLNAIGILEELGCAVGCSKALGQEMHSADKTVEMLDAGKHGGRKQEREIADISPYLFIVQHEEIRNRGLFCDIEVTNKWCTEQCLGDAFLASGLTMEDQHTLSDTAHGFTMGIRYRQ